MAPLWSRNGAMLHSEDRETCPQTLRTVPGHTNAPTGESRGVKANSKFGLFNRRIEVVRGHQIRRVISSDKHQGLVLHASDLLHDAGVVSAMTRAPLRMTCPTRRI